MMRKFIRQKRQEKLPLMTQNHAVGDLSPDASKMVPVRRKMPATLLNRQESSTRPAGEWSVLVSFLLSFGGSRSADGNARF